MAQRHHQRLASLPTYAIELMINKSLCSGVNDIQGFVTLALATAAGGEGDLAHDKLSHLRTVGSGYASLIYIKGRERDDYKMLMERCTSLWEALDKNHHLPELLVR